MMFLECTTAWECLELPHRSTKVPKLAKGDFDDFGGSEPPEPLLEPKSSSRRNSWRVL